MELAAGVVAAGGQVAAADLAHLVAVAALLKTAC
jgi:hypothetical protein